MNLSKKEREFWRSEMKTGDKLAEERMREWQKTLQIYDLNFEAFKGKMRDLGLDEIVPISRFYPLVRQIIASVALNYPKLFFSVDDEDAEGAEELLERAADRYFHLAKVKPHVHQGIFDSLACSVGWLRLDYNPPGDDMIPPYVANDAMCEDLVAVNRVAPWNVRVDPVGSPHMLGHRRYIDEVMWVPLKFLRDDPKITNRKEIRPTVVKAEEQFGAGDILEDVGTPEDVATKESIENGEFVKIHRIHDRLGKRLLMFVDGMFEEISIQDHPFRKMVFPQVMDGLNQPIMDQFGEPMLNLEDGQPAPGWLVQDGFPFIPVKIDLHGSSFYPKAHLKYVEAIQLGIVESVSRQAALLKRTSRQLLASNAELEQNPEIAHKIKRGTDGEVIGVEDVNNFKELIYGSVPQDQYSYEERLRFYEDQITQVTELQRGGGPRRTATESSLIASNANVNREWIDAAISEVYAKVAEGAFRIMGDPRYTPESFIINTAPEGQTKMARTLRGADFLWNFRIKVQAGSAQPLFERLQRDDAVSFYDRAVQHPLADQAALFKHLAKAYDIPDPERLMVDQTNADAQGLAQFENHTIITQMQDPGVQEGQDNKAHSEVHSQYQSHPTYQQISQQAQMEAQAGIQGQAGQRLAVIDQLMQAHMAAHEEAEQQSIPTGQPGTNNPADNLINQVRSNAQDVANQVTA
jgi:hypothetical protein